MIHVILLNPTIDVIYTINDFRVGGTFQVEDLLTFPVGKAISFALAARKVDSDIELNVMALIGQDDISLYSKFLRQHDIHFEFISVKGKTRSNKTINDPINHTTTHIREKGFTVHSKDLSSLKELLREKVKLNDICVFSGSIPPGTSSGIYYELIELVKERGAKCILDTSGPPLIEAIKAIPIIIKPNLLELSQILNDETVRQLNFRDPIKASSILIKKAKILLKQGLEVILITLGENGAIFLSNQYALFGKTELQDEIIDTVGAGDSFLAGFSVPYSKGKKIKDCFKYAIAAGSANCLRTGPGIFERQKMKKLLRSIEIDEIK